jgi:hypothetical protein
MKPITALLVIAVAAALAYTLGVRTAEQPGAVSALPADQRGAVGALPPDQPGAVAEQPSAPGARSAEQPSAAGTRSAGQPSAVAERKPPAAVRMDERALWKLMSATRTKSDGDTERQSGLLEERLSRLPPRAIADFQRIRRRLEKRAYTWDLWGAAYVIEDGCSDDCFRDFRGYLISLGPKAYEAALRDPDSLAPIVEDAETGDWENADSVAADAYESATGDELPVDDSDLSGDPRGEPWDDEDVETLIARYPRLAERFR